VAKHDGALIQLEAAIKITGRRKNASPVAFSQQPAGGPDKFRRTSRNDLLALVVEI